MSKDIAAVVSKMVAELSSLKTDDERERAFAGARAVLGLGAAVGPAPAHGNQGSAAGWNSEGDSTIKGISTSGNTWMKRTGVSAEEIGQFFHIDDGKVTLIGEPPGKGRREKTINTYLLTGVAALLEAGKPSFGDKVAREYCNSSGCYDMPNHNKTLGQFGNQITGSKESGWTLTAPGLTAAAGLLKPNSKSEK